MAMRIVTSEELLTKVSEKWKDKCVYYLAMEIPTEQLCSATWWFGTGSDRRRM